MRLPGTSRVALDAASAGAGTSAPATAAAASVRRGDIGRAYSGARIRLGVRCAGCPPARRGRTASPSRSRRASVRAPRSPARLARSGRRGGRGVRARDVRGHVVEEEEVCRRDPEALARERVDPRVGLRDALLMREDDHVGELGVAVARRGPLARADEAVREEGGRRRPAAAAQPGDELDVRLAEVDVPEVAEERRERRLVETERGAQARVERRLVVGADEAARPDRAEVRGERAVRHAEPAVPGAEEPVERERRLAAVGTDLQDAADVEDDAPHGAQDGAAPPVASTRAGTSPRW